MGAGGRRRVGAVPLAFVIVHFAVVAAPLAVLLAWSLTASWPWPDLLPQDFSLKGFAEIFRPSQNLWSVLAQSVDIAVAVAVLSTLVASLAARALVRHRFAGREVFRFATVLPFLIPSTVFAMGVQVAFIKAGLASTVAGVVLAHSIVALPYAVTIMTDVTAAAGERLEEAASSLGAGPARRLVHVIVPSLMPGLLSSLSMCYIMSFSQYFLTLLIGGGAVKTFALTMFPYLTGGDRTVASAYGVTFLLVTLAVFLLFEFLLKRFGYRAGKDLYGS